MSVNNLGILASLAGIFNFLLNLFKSVLGLGGFIAVTHPMPRITLNIDSYVDSSTGQTIFYLILENLDDRLHMLDVRVSIYLGDPFRGRRFWKNEWISYAEEKGPDVSPGTKTDRIRLMKQGSIENFIDKTFDGRIIKKIPKNSVNPFCYAVIEEMKLKLRVKVSYKSSILRSGRYDFISHYAITPIDGAPERWITNWYVEAA